VPVSVLQNHILNFIFFYLVVALRRKAKYRFYTDAFSLFYVYEKLPHKKWQHLDRDLLRHKVSALVHLVVLLSYHFGLFTDRHISRMSIIENLVRWSGGVSSVVIFISGFIKVYKVFKKSLSRRTLYCEPVFPYEIRKVTQKAIGPRCNLVLVLCVPTDTSSCPSRLSLVMGMSQDGPQGRAERCHREDSP
jgi:hypothetical protein